jgi:hypothetical protein
MWCAFLEPTAELAAWNRKITISEEWIIACPKVLYNTYLDAEENHDKRHSGYLVIGRGFEKGYHKEG